MARPQDVRIRFVGQDNTRGAFRSVVGNADRLRLGIRDTNQQISRLGQTLSTLGGITAGVFAFRGVFQFAENVARADANLDLLRARLDGLGGEDITIADLAASANRLGIGLQDAGDSLTRFLLAGQNIGLTSQQALELSENITKIARVTGAGGPQLQAGVLQLSQALSSGVLQGDELRSVLENIPGVAQKIAEGFNVPVGQLKELGRDGQLTAERVAEILLNVEGLDQEFQKVGVTLDGVNSRLGTAVDRLFAATDFSKAWIGLLGNVADSIDNIRIQFFGADSEIEKVTNRIETLQDRLTRQRPGEPVFERTTAELQALEAQLERLRGPGGTTARTPGTAAGIGAPTTGEEIQALNKLTRKDEEKKMVEQNDEMLTIMRERLGTATAS